MVTHDSRIASYADRIIYLKDGAIVDETHLDPQNTAHSGLVADKMKAMGQSNPG